MNKAACCFACPALSQLLRTFAFTVFPGLLNETEVCGHIRLLGRLPAVYSSSSLFFQINQQNSDVSGGNSRDSGGLSDRRGKEFL